MNKQSCYCSKCKGSVVSKRTFRRHLLKEQNNPYIKPKLNIARQVKNDNHHINIYSNPIPEPMFITYNDVTTSTPHVNNKTIRVI